MDNLYSYPTNHLESVQICDLATTNLTLRQRLDPTDGQIQRNHHNTHNPVRRRIIRAVISEQDCKNDTAQITHSANSATQDTIGMRMNMWHECEISAVARFQEHGHAGNETEHFALVVWVGETDGDEEDAGCDAYEVDPGFLQPQVL